MVDYVAQAIAGNRFDRDARYVLVRIVGDAVTAARLMDEFDFYDRPDGVVKTRFCHPPNLTGTWKCDDDGTYRITQTGSRIHWVATSADQGKDWTHEFDGTLEGDTLSGHYQDRPPGAQRNNGDLVFKVIDENRFTLVRSSRPFGGKVCSRTSSSVAPLPAPTSIGPVVIVVGATRGSAAPVSSGVDVAKGQSLTIRIDPAA